MVGPVSRDERVSFARKVKLGVAALVAVSGGLIAVQADADLPVVVAALLGSFVVGAGLAWFAIPDGDETRSRR